MTGSPAPHSRLPDTRPVPTRHRLDPLFRTPSGTSTDDRGPGTSCVRCQKGRGSPVSPIGPTWRRVCEDVGSGVGEDPTEGVGGRRPRTPTDLTHRRLRGEPLSPHPCRTVERI